MSRRRLGIVIAIAVLAVSACGGGSSASHSGSSQNGGPGGGDQANAQAGHGTCVVDIKGDVTKSWTTKQTNGTLLLTQWLSASSRKILSLSEGEESMILNCDGDGGSISFTTANGTTADMFPKGPKKYVITAGTLIGSDTAGEIGLIIDLKDKAIWSAAEPGTFDVTTFGGSKFAGSFSVKLKSTQDLSTTSATATLSGTFDLSCTGDACS